MKTPLEVVGVLSASDPDVVQVGKIVEAVVTEIGTKLPVDDAAILMGMAFALTRYIERMGPTPAAALRTLDITIDTMRAGMADQLAGGRAGGKA